MGGDLLQLIVKVLATPLLQEFKRVCCVEEALDNLTEILNKARALLNDAESRKVNDETNRSWLSDIEAAAYEADDVVDEFYYFALRHRFEGAGWVAPVNGGSGLHGRVRKLDKMKRFLHTLVAPGTYQFRHEMATRIGELTKKFEEISKRHKQLNCGMLTPREGSGVDSPDGSVTRRETTSLISEPYVFGRKDEVEQIVRALLEASFVYDPSDYFSSCPFPSTSISSSFAAEENTLTVLPIVGIAGIGKTTVAQLVYNDHQVKKHFELLMWVCVSSNFDLRRLTRQIFDYVATSEERSTVDSTTHLDVLHTNLSRKLEGKRFLLVLDDLWNHDRDEWRRLRAPLLRAVRGSAVLVTTRLAVVAENIGTMDAVRLQGLSLNDSKKLLLKCSSVNGHISENFCRVLVEKTKGVPLAIKTMGNILSSKPQGRWEEILERDIWELQQSETDILPVLKLSYENLPPHLKRCFAYCSLFPKDYEFDKLRLVKHWMAQGYIQQQQSSDRMDDAASSYFDDLHKRSFFQKVGNHFVMHDFYHDLAQSIPNRRIARITSSEHNSIDDIQDNRLLHLSFSILEVKPIEEKLSLANHLRSFVFIANYVNRPLALTDSLVGMLRCVRVLDLSRSSIRVLPESVGSLIHLRFLDISYTKVEALPDSICVLYNLQSLELSHCNCLKEIPRGLQNLINLRHLTASDDLINTLSGIGKLTSLQELKLFNVSKEEGHRIWELKNLNELRDKLCIRNIQNIETREEAAEANLQNKKHLHELVFEWSTKFTSDANKDCTLELDGLLPPSNVKVLSIIGNRSLQPPLWMNYHNVSNLTAIWLRDCRNWESLPPLGPLPYLESLEIEYLTGVTEADPKFFGNGVMFPSLRNLVIRHMHLLRKWAMPSESRAFPRLKKLVVEDCPQLGSVVLRTSLRILKIEKCPKLLITNFLLSGPSLHSLSWSFENSYRDLPSCVGSVFHHLSFLKELEISFIDEHVTDNRWSQRPPWMPFSYSQGRAADEQNISNLSLNIHNYNDIRVFLFYAYNFPDYPDVDRCHTCIRIRNKGRDDASSCYLLSTCLQKHLISLQHVSVRGCEMIGSLLGESALLCLNSLKDLVIDGCMGMMQLRWFPKQEFLTLRLLTLSNCPDLTAFPPLKLTMLEKLQFHNCEGLSYLDLHGLVSLKCLEILGCAKLRGSSIASKLTALEELKLRKCPNLIVTLDDMENGLQCLTSLKILEISLCQNLRQLPRNLHNLTSLKTLLIMQCPDLRSLPKSGLSRSLNELRIEGCPLLQQNCQMGEPDWPRVSYILKRRISCSRCYPYKCTCKER